MAMQRNYFTVLFFLKKSKLLKNGEAPICMRITINGKRAEVQIKRSIDVTKWNTQKECAIGREKKYQEINHYLDTIRTKILQIHRELEQDGKPITADIIKNIYYGEHSTPKMLLEVFQEHNSEYRELMNKEYAEGTVLRYERTARYLKEFISEQYKLADILTSDSIYGKEGALQNVHFDAPSCCYNMYSRCTSVNSYLIRL